MFRSCLVSKSMSVVAFECVYGWLFSVRKHVWGLCLRKSCWLTYRRGLPVFVYLGMCFLLCSYVF